MLRHIIRRKFSSKGQKLRELLINGSLQPIAKVRDASSTAVFEQAGFQALWVSQAEVFGPQDPPNNELLGHLVSGTEAPVVLQCDGEYTSTSLPEFVADMAGRGFAGACVNDGVSSVRQAVSDPDFLILTNVESSESENADGLVLANDGPIEKFLIQKESKTHEKPLIAFQDSIAQLKAHSDKQKINGSIYQYHNLYPKNPNAFEGFKYSVVDDHIGVITLNRTKKLNAMTPQFFKDITQIFQQIDADPKIRVVVLNAEGRIFTAGIDLMAAGSLLKPAGDDPGRIGIALNNVVIPLQESFMAIEQCGKPVIAVAHSKVVGGGVDMISSCDIRYCSKDTEITIKEVDIGMAADLGTLQRMNKICGNDSWVRELVYTARWAGADECASNGFFSKVLDDRDAANAAAMELAKTIAGKSPVAIYSNKKILNFSRDHPVADGLEYNRVWNNAALQTKDMMVAITANLGKTEPEFEDF